MKKNRQCECKLYGCLLLTEGGVTPSFFCFHYPLLMNNLIRAYPLTGHAVSLGLNLYRFPSLAFGMATWMKSDPKFTSLPYSGFQFCPLNAIKPFRRYSDIGNTGTASYGYPEGLLVVYVEIMGERVSWIRIPRA